MASDGSNRNTWLALSVFVVLGGGALMLLPASQPPQPEAPAAPGAPPTPKVAGYEPATPSTEEVPRPEVKVEPAAAPPQDDKAEQEAGEVDLFAGATSDLITDAHRRLLDGKRIGASMTKKLYDFGQEHPKDPRPQLLMAHDGMKQKRYGIAVRLYRIAWQADEAAKHDPKMLGDLVYVAATHDKVEHREAVEVITMIYGEESLEEIDRSLASARAAMRPRLIARLEKLRSAVGR